MGMYSRCGAGWLSRSRERLQAVLHDRFGLELRRELRELPIYGLSVAKTGHKLTVPAEPGKSPSLNINGGQRIIAKSSTMKSLADALSMLLGRFVHEETGLEGPYGFKLEFAPDLAVQALGVRGPLSRSMSPFRRSSPRCPNNSACGWSRRRGRLRYL